MANAMLNQGAPTEILPALSTSTTSGASVPAKTSNAAITSSTLFNSRKVSRDSGLKPAAESSAGARQAYKINALRMTMPRNPRMKNPRAGSVANACTDTRMPERTRKVPSRLSEKAAMASNSVQLLNRPRFSVTASE